MATSADLITRDTTVHPDRGGAWDNYPIVNQYPEPTAAQLAEARKLDEDIRRWDRCEGHGTDEPGGLYQHDQISADLHRKRESLLRGGMILAERIQDTTTGEVPPLYDTRYGLRYKLADGRWLPNDASDRTLAKRGLRRCLVWIPADGRFIGQARGPFRL